jgi:hypothetical protein
MALPAVADLFKSSFEDPLKKLLQPAGVMPAIVLVGLNLTAIYPTLIDKKVGLATTFEDLDGAWQLGITAIVIILLGYVILAFSPSVLRIATGEGWQTSLLRPLLLWHQTRNRNNVRDRPADAGPKARARDYELRTRFPARADELAPTSLGNALSAVGDGIFDSYGLDLTATWTQMRTVVRKENSDFVAEIDDAQVGFLSLLNLAAVLVIFALEGLVLALLLNTDSFSIPAVASLVAAYFAYRGAVARVASWGDQVAAAYDLYRPKFREVMELGKALTSDYERLQFRALSSALLWNDGNRWFTASEPPQVALLSSPSIAASLVSSEASRPVVVAGPMRSEVKRVFDYLMSIEATSKDAQGVVGVVEVTDRRLPTRIGRTPESQTGPPSCIATIRRRSDLGLRDSLLWTITGLDGGKASVLAYHLEWVVSIDIDDPPEPNRVAIVEGATDLNGLVLLLVQMTISEEAIFTITMRDDRLARGTRLRALYRLDRDVQQLEVTPGDYHWVIKGRLPNGSGRLEVRRDDD